MSGLVVNTNMNALTIENTLSNTNAAVSGSLEKLSSGLRINSAQDDPAGFAIANSFKASIASMQVASQNANQANSMLQTADGAYSQINNILVQMKSLATEAASGQESGTNLTSLQGEFSDLSNEINSIANSTQYGNSFLINGSVSGAITFQVGATNDSNDQIGLTFNSATATALGVNALNISSNSGAQAAMTTLDTALTSINAFMGDVGSSQNQLQYTINNLTTSIQNYTASTSTIEDVDMAAEVSNMTKNQILQQSAMAMLAQANAQPQSILKLLG
ncbi:Flagellin domain protein [Syntrophobacter sp. SbD1]|nr:Flagellin domain protein [Syntrophobacter sp. SbD1]